jgi:ABC-2 type transport system ATP-binding protein
MNTQADVVIEIQNLTKDYQVGFLKKRTVRALNQLSLEVKRGEIFGFLGPNGAGKTTTLKILMRLIYPTAGEARILGQPLDHNLMRGRIGYLPENPYFYDYLTGRELLAYSAALFGIPEAAAGARANQLLSLVGLEPDRANRQLRKYSKGMLQRIGIAQALINDPEVIFMDEPMSGLDPIGRREVRDLMLSLREQNKTVFFSSHILSDVEALCDRAAILTKGRLVRSGTVQQLTGEEEAFEIIATEIDASTMEQLSRNLPFASAFHLTPNGIHFVVRDEDRLGEAINAIHQVKGRLLSVNPKRSSLEDIFSSAEQASNASSENAIA